MPELEFLDEEVWSCDDCGTTDVDNQSSDYPDVCVNCLQPCAVCGGHWTDWNRYYSGVDDAYYCENHTAYCEHCDEIYGANQASEYCRSCRADYDSPSGASFVNYSYKPEPVFFGTGPMYLGVEHEMDFNSPDQRRDVMELAARQNGLYYFKTDASLGQYGCEFITHPMGFDFAINDYPYEVVDEMRRQDGDPESNAGIHIHMSRDGFTSAYHMWKFIHFHMANPLFVRKVAGRMSHWAKFDTRPAQRRITKPGAVDMSLGGLPIYDIVRKYKGGAATNDRYLAINAQNAATIELRYFASTTDQAVLRGYFDYLKALYQYTLEAKVRNRQHPERSLSGLAFRKWAVESGDYPHFARLMELRTISMESLGPVEAAPFTGKEQ